MNVLASGVAAVWPAALVRVPSGRVSGCSPTRRSASDEAIAATRLKPSQTQSAPTPRHQEDSTNGFGADGTRRRHFRSENEFTMQKDRPDSQLCLAC